MGGFKFLEQMFRMMALAAEERAWKPTHCLASMSFGKVKNARLTRMYSKADYCCI